MDLSETQLDRVGIRRGRRYGRSDARRRLVDDRCWARWRNGRNRCEPACASCWAPGIRCSFPGARTTRCSTTTPTEWSSERSTRGRWVAVAARCWPRRGISSARASTRSFKEGQPISTLTHQLFTFRRNNYLEECYFAFSYSPIPDDSGRVGGVLTNALDMTERVIEDRRRQVLRDLASRTAEARHEEEVWRVSAETLGDNRSSAPFAFLYEYLPGEQKACLARRQCRDRRLAASGRLDCTGESICGDSTQRCRRIACWWNLAIAHQRCRFRAGRPLPGRRRFCRSGCASASEAAGFLVLGIHPGRAFDDAYRHFVRRIAEQIAIGLASARAYEQERQRAEALAEIDRAKTASSATSATSSVRLSR